MELIVTVQQVFPDGTAEVIREKELCHGNCAHCGGCEEPEPFRVNNPMAAKPGDRVILHATSKAARKTALMLYTIPVALLLAGYLLGEHFLAKGGFFGILGGVVGLWLVLTLDKQISKRYPITYEITGIAEEKPE